MPSYANTPKISSDGSKVAYSITNWGPPRNSGETFVVPFAGGAAKKVCDHCIAAWDWSADGGSILFGWFRPHHLSLIDIRSGKETRLAEHPDWQLWNGHLSPDNRWLAFVAVGPGESQQIFIAPLQEQGSSPPDVWIPVTDKSASADAPKWSPDGDRLYFVSAADGFRCLWTQRLDPTSKRPVAAADALRHFHSARETLRSHPVYTLSVVRDRLLFTLSELTGNIWMAAPQP